MVMSACSVGASNPEFSGSAAEATGLVAPASPAVPEEILEVDMATLVFLAVVCPTDTALQFLGNVPPTEGGWQNVAPSMDRPYVEAAVAAAAPTATDLDDVTAWPESVTTETSAVSDEYLAMLAPLERINQATKGNAMKAA